MTNLGKYTLIFIFFGCNWIVSNHPLRSQQAQYADFYIDNIIIDNSVIEVDSAWLDNLFNSRKVPQLNDYYYMYLNNGTHLKKSDKKLPRYYMTGSHYYNEQFNEFISKVIFRTSLVGDGYLEINDFISRYLKTKFYRGPFPVIKYVVDNVYPTGEEATEKIVKLNKRDLKSFSIKYTPDTITIDIHTNTPKH